MTVNTDFAQVEADDTQVNLTRFSLFFPDKREFFLESAGIFDFGLERNGQLFFSRRIGIAEGQSAPILGRGRLTGKVGPYSIGMMSMQTRNTDVQASSNYTAVRGRRDFAERSTVGAILTTVTREGYDNRAAGVDATLWFTPALQLKSFVAVTEGSDIDDRALSHYGSLSYQTDPWGLSAAEKSTEGNFQPGLGYIRRTDIRELTGSVRRRYRLNRPWSRNIDFTGSIAYLTDVDERLLTREQEFDITNVRPTGDQVRDSLPRQFEQLTEPFRIMPNVTIPLDARLLEDSVRRRPGRLLRNIRASPRAGRLTPRIAARAWGRGGGGELLYPEPGGECAHQDAHPHPVRRADRRRSLVDDAWHAPRVPDGSLSAADPRRTRRVDLYHRDVG